MISFGIVIYLEAQISTGGIAGLSLLIQYATNWNFGAIFFLANLPFFILSLMRMGLLFSIKTFICVISISLLSGLIPVWISFSHLNPIFASVCGGALIGIGSLSLFRHRAGVGGMSILAQFLQEKKALNAGYFMLCFDVIVLSSGFFILPWKNVLISILGAITLNIIVAINHRPGRYAGISFEKKFAAK